MEKLTNLLRGCAVVEVRGANPALFLNQCAGAGIPFWDVETVDEFTLRVHVYKADCRRLEAVAGRAQCSQRVVRRRGAPYILRRLRRRYVLLAGLLAFLLAIGWSSLYIWEIEVTGNETVSDTEILRVLEECGVGVGSFWPAFTSDNIRSQVLLRLPELQWMTVNVFGSRAEVIVREAIPMPEIVDEDAPVNIVAEKTGLIQNVEAYRGEEAVEPGEMVLPGEVLVRGAVGSTFSATRILHARGEVMARTWYTLTASASLTVQEKVYTGEETHRFALLLGETRINFYQNGGISDMYCDKMIETSRLSLAGIFVLPVGYTWETCRVYELVETARPEEEVRTELEILLMEALTAEIGESGSVTEFSYSAARDGDKLTVTLHAECLEDIGVEAPMSQEELSAYDLPPQEGEPDGQIEG